MGQHVWHDTSQGGDTSTQAFVPSVRIKILWHSHRFISKSPTNIILTHIQLATAQVLKKGHDMSTIDWKAIYGTPGHLKVKDLQRICMFWGSELVWLSNSTVPKVWFKHHWLGVLKALLLLKCLTLLSMYILPIHTYICDQTLSCQTVSNTVWHFTL